MVQMVLTSSDNSLIQYSFSWQLRTLQCVAKTPYFSNIYLELTKIEKYDFDHIFAFFYPSKLFNSFKLGVDWRISCFLKHICPDT